MDFGFVQRVLDLVGEDTGGEAGDDLVHLGFIRSVKDVVVYEHIVAKKTGLQHG